MHYIKGINFFLKIDRPLIMGILNVTPDSFSDGGKYLKPEAAVRQVRQMAAEGADIIDIGGESTRPYARPVSLKEELKRVVPIIRAVRKKVKNIISVDTYKSEVAAAALEEGADIINDISALRMDACMGEVAARYGAPVVLMHMQGSPGNMQKNPRYRNVVSDVVRFLKKSISTAQSYGIKKDRIVLDPGIGFGKSVEHNLQIIKNLEKLSVLGCPLLVGPSRKSFIGKILDTEVDQRVEGTAAAVAISVWNGADIVRVHDVREMKRVADMTWRIRQSVIRR